MDLSVGVVQYHVERLVSMGMIVFRRDQRYKRFFEARRYGEDELTTYSLLRRDTTRRILGYLDDNGGAYFVPAFSGLFAPYWRPEARGALVGLTRFVNKSHIARAALEATAFQTREVFDAMNADSGVNLTELRVDGGMVANELLMQFQADQLGVDVVRPKVAQTTALGAAYAAGIAVGFWQGEADVIANWSEDKRWSPTMAADERSRLYRNWKKAVTKTMDWVDDDVV